MSTNAIFITAMVLSVIAAVCFVAGSETFAVLPENIANLAGIAAGGAAAVFWVIYARSTQRK